MKPALIALSILFSVSSFAGSENVTILHEKTIETAEGQKLTVLKVKSNDFFTFGNVDEMKLIMKERCAELGGVLDSKLSLFTTKPSEGLGVCHH